MKSRTLSIARRCIGSDALEQKTMRRPSATAGKGLHACRNRAVRLALALAVVCTIDLAGLEVDQPVALLCERRDAQSPFLLQVPGHALELLLRDEDELSAVIYDP